MASSKDQILDDEIEFLYERPAEQIICQFCSENITKKSLEQKQEHYDSHFADQNQASTSSESSTVGTLQSTAKTWFKRNIHSKDENKQIREDFWYCSKTTPPPENFCPGLITVLKKALVKAHEKGQTQRAWLCHRRVVHIHSETFDRGWGCGYRNFLMACTALMDQTQQSIYFPLLDAPTPPSVRNLQHWIEEAWKQGFDEEGAGELQHKLVGTKKWIGTAELYVAFTHRRIPAQLVDFDLTKGKSVQVLVEWVVRYFSAGHSHPQHTTVDEALRGAHPVIVTDKMPLVLQHKGHSRTIVGYEQTRSGAVNLLQFDPSSRIDASIRRAGLAYHTSVQPVEDARERHHSPKTLHKALHPIETIKSQKRKASDLVMNDPAKRVRAGGTTQLPSEDVIVIEDDDGDYEIVKKTIQDPDTAKVLKTFRLTEAQLRYVPHFRLAVL
ncbi:hypothetical protein AcV5_006299 [Taiwanofungus camphoratus]|nr:hypothetical protein AcW2_004734 [Antrodia cinnamomea]KAI0934466.1 hypothetical protein AcV5_006299 [Antrodia cinnamomea]